MSADIFAIGVDGRGLARVTGTPLAETSPSVSPDGAKLAFVRSRRRDGAPDHTVYVRTLAAKLSDWLSPPSVGGFRPIDLAR